MSHQLQIDYPSAGESLYVLLRDMTGEIWNGSAFEAYTTANLNSYDIPLTEQGTASKRYVAAFPSISAGRYFASAFVQAGASPAESDIGPVSIIWYDWNGTTIVGEVIVNVSGLDLTLEDVRLHYTVPDSRLHYTLSDTRLHYTLPDTRLHYTVPAG